MVLLSSGRGRPSACAALSAGLRYSPGMLASGATSTVGGARSNDEQRLDALLAAPVFGLLPGDVLAGLAHRLCEELHEVNATVFAEGEPGDRLVLIVDGEAELSARGSVGVVPLATLGPGDMTGELSLMSDAHIRNATLTALTPLHVLTLDARSFHEFLDTHPQTRADFEHHAQELLTARFVKHVGPFMSMDDEARRWLATQLRTISLPAGEELIRQGDPGDRCYLVRSGKLDVLVSDPVGGELNVGSMGPGTVVGEAALLTEAPRAATVRAVEHCEVLELTRDALDAVAKRDPTVGREMVQLLRLRERPQRAPGVLLSELVTPDGELLTTLKHPVHRTYYRLSARGRFIWDRLDGLHDLRALTREFLQGFGQLSPQMISEVVAGLAAAKMIEVRRISHSLEGRPERAPRGGDILTRARGLIEKEVSLRDVDAAVTRAYTAGLRLFFTPLGQLVLALLAVGGLVAFVALAASADGALTGSNKTAALFVVPGFLCGTFLHEAGHALTVKAFGRTVNGAGVGWYWFAPVAFVDTSDMWLATRRERILVSLAGPYTDLVLAGCASIAGVLVTGATPRAVLWSFALPSYLAVVVNLNPLLEYDGYHVLSDLLDRPNLRAEALGWLGANLLRARRDRRELRRHRVDLLYGVGAVLYIAVMGVASIVVYRLVVEGWIAAVVPAGIARALAWVLAGSVTLLASLGLAADVRGSRRESD